MKCYLALEHESELPSRTSRLVLRLIGSEKIEKACKKEGEIKSKCRLQTNTIILVGTSTRALLYRQDYAKSILAMVSGVDDVGWWGVDGPQPFHLQSVASVYLHL